MIKKFNEVDFILNFEMGLIDNEQEVIYGFQKLIDSGMVWSLQGQYGRIAKKLINEGYCKGKE
jgi:hypothetical protein